MNGFKTGGGSGYNEECIGLRHGRQGVERLGSSWPGGRGKGAEGEKVKTEELGSDGNL